MKRLLLLSAFIAFAMASCVSKAKVNPIKPVLADTISATIDSVNETFNTLDTAQLRGSTGLYISGTNAATSDKIIFILGSTNGMTTGTYSSTASANNYIQMLYGKGPGFTANNYYYNYNISGGPSYDGTVTITAISSSRVRGTFTGTLVLESSVTSTGTRPTKTITNGKFNLSIKQ